MNNFFKGILFGVGVGLLVAPMRGEEMRTMLRDRFESLRSALPENEQLNQYTQQISGRVSQTASNLKDYAQQAASTVRTGASNLGDLAQNAASAVKGTASDLGNIAQNAGSEVKSGAQDVADTAKTAALNVKSNATNNSVTTTYPETNSSL